MIMLFPFILSGIKRSQSRLTEALLLPDSVQSLHGAEILIYCVHDVFSSIYYPSFSTFYVLSGPQKYIF